MYRLLHLAVCILLGFVLFAAANTEIRNFEASYSTHVAVPAASRWRTLSADHPELHLNMQPAPLQIPLSAVCEPMGSDPCPHEVWIALSLDDAEWVSFHKFTLRISWPASSPADFSIQMFSPAELSTRLDSKRTAPLIDTASPQTRLQYARIRLVDTGVRTPGTNLPPNPAVPFIVRLEPLYLGVLPASVLPVLLFLLPVVAFAALVMVPRTQKYLAAVANDAKRELLESARSKED